jgi:hypothetical protein
VYVRCESGAGNPADSGLLQPRKELSMNDVLDLSIEALDDIESPMTTGEGVGIALIAFGGGILIGLAIT